MSDAILTMILSQLQEIARDIGGIKAEVSQVKADYVEAMKHLNNVQNQCSSLQIKFERLAGEFAGRVGVEDRTNVSQTNVVVDKVEGDQNTLGKVEKKNDGPEK